MADSVRFSQSHGIVPIAHSVTGSYANGFTGESVNMAKYNHYTLIIIGDDAISGGGKLKIHGATSDGGTTADLTFAYRYSAGDIAAASGDVLGTPETSAELTITGASLLERMLVCELDAQDLVVSGATYQWVTPILDSSGGGGYVTMVAILSEPRYMEAVMDTAI